ncbi:MAG: thymidine phosphorylase [Acidimicrobiales bacterium]
MTIDPPAPLGPTGAAFDAVDVIRTKRDGGRLSAEQIRWFLDAYTAGRIADEQASAMTMAIFWRGLAPDELATWTAAMIDSGERLDLRAVGRPTVDKHSTGGVGDKVSLVLCPLVAACGAAVPQLSGRGLGHTGGTLDKMEAIAGWRAQLTNDQIVDQLRDIGAVICAAGAGLAPADRKLYALRDVTATVESIPLIASSIMSKKIAEGTDALVLDVKYGAGAFLPDPERGRELARTMVALGEAHGVRTAALLTAMESPLGLAAGNAVEVAEAVECLAGGGPDDLRAVTLELARTMLRLAGLDGGADPADVLDGGAAMDRWRAMVAAQGGDPAAPLPVAVEREVLTAPTGGYLRRLDARAVGVAAWRLGAGRARKEDPVSPIAGVLCRAKPGDRVVAGQPLLELHIDDPARVPAALDALRDAFEISASQPTPDELPPLVLDRIDG